MTIAPVAAPVRHPTSLIVLLCLAPVAMVTGTVAAFVTHINQSFDGRLPAGPYIAVLAVEMAVAIAPAIALLVLSIRGVRRRLSVLPVLGILFSIGSLLLATLLSGPNLLLTITDSLNVAVAQSHPLTPAETAHTAKQLRAEGDAFAIATGRSVEGTQVTSPSSTPAFIDSCSLSTRNVGKMVSSEGLFFTTDWSEKRVEEAIAANWEAAGLTVNYTDATAARGDTMVHASGKNYTNVTAFWTGSTTGEYNIDITYDTICVSK